MSGQLPDILPARARSGPPSPAPFLARLAASDRLLITWAVPPQSRRAWDQATWLGGMLADVGAQGWQTRRAETCSRVLKELARHMDWSDRTSWPGHARLAAAARCSTRTVTRVIAWAADRGWLGLVSPGTTESLSPVARPRPPEHVYGAVLRSTRDPERARRAALPHALAGTGRRRARYVLAVPRSKHPKRRHCAGQSRIGDLSPHRVVGRRPHRKDNGENRNNPDKDRTSRGRPPGPAGAAGAWPLGRPPETRADGLAAARALQDHFGLLRRITAEHVRSLAKWFSVAGWTPRDWLRAIDERPGGKQWRLGPAGGAGHVPRAVRWRLAHWITWATPGPDDPGRLAWIRRGGPPFLHGGQVQPSASQRTAAAAAESQARADQLAGELATGHGGAPPNAEYLAARAAAFPAIPPPGPGPSQPAGRPR